MSNRNYRVSFTGHAERDLEEIVDYLKGHIGASEALVFVDTVVDHAKTLRNFSFRGPIPRELNGTGEDKTRQLSFRKYRIFYDVVGDSVSVFAVVDARREVGTLLAERLLDRAASGKAMGSSAD